MVYVTKMSFLLLYVHHYLVSTGSVLWLSGLCVRIAVRLYYCCRTSSAGDSEGSSSPLGSVVCSGTVALVRGCTALRSLVANQPCSLS